MFKKVILENGLRVLTAPMKGTNTVTTLVMVGTGSDYENKNNNGVSHFLEHMFFKGTKKRPHPTDIMRELDSIGSVSNAFTSHEFTGYFIKAGKTYLDNSLDILSDIYKNSLFKEEEIRREKKVIIEELNKDKDTPTKHIWRLWERLLYGDQPAGWEVGGSKEALNKLSRPDFIKYFGTHYVSANTAIVVAGNFDESVILEKIKKFFDGIRIFSTFGPPEAVEGQKSPVVKAVYKDTDQTHIACGFRSLPITHKDIYIVQVLATVTGGTWSSRMFEAIREKLGLAYTVRTFEESYSNRGYFVTYAGVGHGSAVRAVSEIMEEYRKIFDKGFTEKELKRAKDYIKGTSLIGMEASDAVADFIGIEEIVTGQPLTIDEVFGKIDKVTVQDLKRLARETFKPAGLNLVVLGPHKNKKEFEKVLKL